MEQRLVEIALQLMAICIRSPHAADYTTELSIASTVVTFSAL